MARRHRYCLRLPSLPVNVKRFYNRMFIHTSERVVFNQDCHRIVYFLYLSNAYIITKTFNRRERKETHLFVNQDQVLFLLR